MSAVRNNLDERLTRLSAYDFFHAYRKKVKITVNWNNLKSQSRNYLNTKASLVNQSIIAWESFQKTIDQDCRLELERVPEIRCVLMPYGRTREEQIETRHKILELIEAVTKRPDISLKLGGNVIFIIRYKIKNAEDRFVIFCFQEDLLNLHQLITGRKHGTIFGEELETIKTALLFDPLPDKLF